MQRLFDEPSDLVVQQGSHEHCSSRARWQVEPLFWVMALNLDASPLLKSFIKMKLRPRDVKALFQMGRCNYSTVFEGKISKKKPICLA